MEVPFPLIGYNERPHITRIRANAMSSAAFDDTNNKFFTWGDFGRMKPEVKGGGQPPIMFPKLHTLITL